MTVPSPCPDFQVTAQADPDTLAIDLQPRFELSPYLYMQFMEPLGTTDGSVAAAWDHQHHRWRDDVLQATRELAPALVRWGGCFSSFYRWKEAVGPRSRRRPMVNLLWGGIESNQVGTHEFLDFCRQVSCHPLLAVNFEADGRPHWARPENLGVRAAGPAEAAAWVAYCNDPANPLRRRHGVADPYNVRLWQIGNETSYDKRGYDCETAGRRTVAFAKAMKQADPSIQLIGWGDSGWARRMLEMAGEHLSYLAFHHMFNPDRGQDNSPLRDTEFRKDPAATWEHLMNAWRVHEQSILRLRQETAGYSIPLAMTECHFSLPGRNRCEVLSTWAAGVADARMLNLHERHGDVLKIATLADFCGTRWQVNALMIPTPRGRSYLMPVGRVMSLYRQHQGAQALNVLQAPPDLDVTASRTGDTIFLHVVNTHRTRAVAARLAIDDSTILVGRIHQIAVAPEAEITETCPDLLNPVVLDLPADRRCFFPPASVSALELSLKPKAEEHP